MATRRMILGYAAATLAAAPIGFAAAPQLAPEFTSTDAADWINSPPLTLAALRGRPVLVEFWTYGCSNCRNTLPWLKAAYERYEDRGLTIVGVHTPEFAHERDADKVRAAVRKLGIAYPVMLDPESSYWNAFNNRYWPAFYLIDGAGRIAANAIGELHSGQSRATKFESSIEKVLRA